MSIPASARIRLTAVMLSQSNLVVCVHDLVPVGLTSLDDLDAPGAVRFRLATTPI